MGEEGGGSGPDGGGEEVRAGEDRAELSGLFKKKKSSKKRLRSRGVEDVSKEDEEDNENKKGESPAEVGENLAPLLEAQKLRQRQRRWTADASQAVSGIPKHAVEDEEEALVVGLRTNFATEREDEDLEQQLEKYIDDQMVAKGYTVAKGGLVSAPANPEDELYHVPEALRVEKRTAYDPGEGLPAAGLEEVDIDDEARKRSHMKTEEAVKDLPGSRTAKATDHIVAEHFRKRFRR
ncbi:hypothetical protein NDN08_008242 [Rhodosorus marinus]|uniref:Hepatocellular carcinoma-associated antigen 59 n=1 Tax=Rhodosorus marinus TaxID=101924 RepID=A0AAV8UZT1_9RHOD|nr:hypothetical protein NDN08_008242 [Rhodosorus marinus]